MPVTTVDDTAASGGDILGQVIDETSLEGELSRNVRKNRAVTQPYRAYMARVIKAAGVPDAQATREMASIVCGAVARLPFLPDDTEPLDESGKTEFEMQIIKTAEYAERQLDSEMVWTASARKLARAALEIRKQDPDGSQKIAWVNDPNPGERKRKALPRALRGEEPIVE